jgi:hypothetical protein
VPGLLWTKVARRRTHQILLRCLNSLKLVLTVTTADYLDCILKSIRMYFQWFLDYICVCLFTVWVWGGPTSFGIQGSLWVSASCKVIYDFAVRRMWFPLDISIDTHKYLQLDTFSTRWKTNIFSSIISFPYTHEFQGHFVRFLVFIHVFSVLVADGGLASFLYTFCLHCLCLITHELYMHMYLCWGIFLFSFRI